MKIPLSFIERQMLTIRDNYDAELIHQQPVHPALISFLALADAIGSGCEDVQVKKFNQAQTIKRVCDDIVAAEDLSATIDGIMAEPDVPEGVCGKCGWGLIVRGQDSYECPNCYGYIA